MYKNKTPLERKATKMEGKLSKKKKQLQTLNKIAVKLQCK